MAPKVLIVDDDPLVRVLYKRQLEEAGYQLLTANDGNEVVRIASRELPQLIVMDVIMAGLDGLAALRQLKKTEATKAIPVVIVTATVSGAHGAARQESGQAGAAGFLTKPFSPAQLLTEVRRLVPVKAGDGTSGQAQ